MVGKLEAAGIFHMKNCKDKALALRIKKRESRLERDFGGRTSTGVLDEGIWPQGGKNWLRLCEKFIDVTVVYGL